MHNVFMTSGIFRPIFGYCTCDAAGVEELYFDKLFEAEEHGSVFRWALSVATLFRNAVFLLGKN
jgi:hypothetical protein